MTEEILNCFLKEEGINFFQDGILNICFNRFKKTDDLKKRLDLP